MCRISNTRDLIPIAFRPLPILPHSYICPPTISLILLKQILDIIHFYLYIFQYMSLNDRALNFLNLATIPLSQTIKYLVSVQISNNCKCYHFLKTQEPNKVSHIAIDKSFKFLLSCWFSHYFFFPPLQFIFKKQGYLSYIFSHSLIFATVSYSVI